MKIVSIIHSFLEPANLNPVFEALSKMTLAKNNHEIVVVENGIEDSMQSEFSNFVFLKNAKFIGFSQALNLGVKYAVEHQADFIWLTDPFHLPFPDMFSQLIQASDSYKNCLVFAPKVYKDVQNKILDSAGYTTDWTNLTFTPLGQNDKDGLIYDHDLEIDYAPTNQAFFLARAWSEVGLFDTRYFTKYFDIDLYQRLRSHGYRLNYISLAHAQKFGLPPKLPSSANDYYSLRDKTYFSLLRAPATTKIIALRESIKKYYKGEPWERRAILDFFTGNLGDGSYQW